MFQYILYTDTEREQVWITLSFKSKNSGKEKNFFKCSHDVYILFSKLFLKLFRSRMVK